MKLREDTVLSLPAFITNMWTMNLWCSVNLPSRWQHCIPLHHQPTRSKGQASSWSLQVLREWTEPKAGKTTYSRACDPPSQTWSGSISEMHSTENWNRWTEAKAEVLGTQGREEGQGGVVGIRSGWGLQGRATLDAPNRWGYGAGSLQALFYFTTIQPQKFLTSCIPTSNSACHGHLATHIPWEVSSWRSHIRSIQARERKSPKSEVPWQWVSYKSVFPLGHLLEGRMRTSHVPTP